MVFELYLDKFVRRQKLHTLALNDNPRMLVMV